jgi:hypothetical protein
MLAISLSARVIRVRSGARALASGTKGAQAGADFADQDLRLFQGREVPALVGFAVVDQIAVGVFDPASRQVLSVLDWNFS